MCSYDHMFFYFFLSTYLFSLLILSALVILGQIHFGVVLVTFVLALHIRRHQLLLPCDCLLVNNRHITHDIRHEQLTDTDIYVSVCSPNGPINGSQ